MPRKGFLRPDTFVETGGGGFKEGNVRVDSACYRVHHPDVPAGQEDRGAYVALVWNVTRLDEDLEAMIDPATDDPMTEELLFGAGGKSLAQIHPAIGSSPDDEEVEDQGDQDGAEGNTLHFVNEEYALNKKSSLAMLMMSLGDGNGKHFPGVHFPAEAMDRIWAPDWVGCIFHMKTWIDAENKVAGRDGVERGINYKIVTKILSRGKEKGKGKEAGAAKGKTEAAAGGKANGKVAGNEAEEAVGMVLTKVSEGSESGEAMTYKAFWQKCSKTLDELKVDGKLKLPVMSLYKDEKWLAKNAVQFGLTVDSEARTVTAD